MNDIVRTGLNRVRLPISPSARETMRDTLLE